MARITGTYRTTVVENEEIRAFVPNPLPPTNPPLAVGGASGRPERAGRGRHRPPAVAADMVPSADWFLYGFVRKEAVVSSQIEGTQATLRDVIAFEAARKSERPADVAEVCNYVDALSWARAELSGPGGLPLSTRLLCEAHKRLMQGAGRGKTARRRPHVAELDRRHASRQRPLRTAPGGCLPDALANLRSGFTRTTRCRPWCGRVLPMPSSRRSTHSSTATAASGGSSSRCSSSTGGCCPRRSST